MKHGVFKIGKPYISKGISKVKLNAPCSVMEDGNVAEVILWFEVKEKFEEFLCLDRVDSFVVAVIPYCITHRLDIVVDSDTAVSAPLLLQIQEDLLPTLKFRYSEEIELRAEGVHTCLAGGGIATSASLGVDSFYSILNSMHSSMPLTHLCLFNVQAFGESGGGGRAGNIFCRRGKG